MNRKNATLILTMFLAIGCRPPNTKTVRSDSAAKEFVPFQESKVVETLKPEDPLSHIKTIDDISSVPKISYDVRRISSTSMVGGTKAFMTSLEIIFPNLTPAQCLAVRHAYRDLSKITCQRTGKYNLADFMPPSIQALNTSNFRDEISAKNQIQANCWSTAFEILRLDRRTYLLTLMEPKPVQETIVKNSQQKIMGDATQAQQWIEKEGEFLDAILVEASKTDVRNEDQGIFVGSLLHAAVLIDKNGLIFEKKTITDFEGFHFTDFQTMSGTDSGRFHIRRPNAAMPSQASLPAGWRTSGQGCVRIPFVEDSEGRSTFPPWASEKGQLLSRMEGSEPCLN
jgi:hypothetical protein